MSVCIVLIARNDCFHTFQGYDEATESFLLNDGHGLGPEAPDLESASEKLARLRSRSNGGHPHSKGVRKKLGERNEDTRVFKDTIPRDKLMGRFAQGGNEISISQATSIENINACTLCNF